MPNRLAGETSPYLLQHAENPVDWYPWGDEAFARAREEDRPVRVSIGYSACHWCHVMERESFEDASVAALMNDRFVCIKVDREERPDVDAIYMDAVQAMTGQGGWPLNVFLTPEQIPFFGGTYFPPEPRHGMPSWPQVLDGIASAWDDQREEIRSQAGRIIPRLTGAAALQAPEGELDPASLDAAVKGLRRAHDA
ncbi:MAG: thioredoxin domain-containing protein, partial [Candidatus Limnocylindria bacterium]